MKRKRTYRPPAKTTLHNPSAAPAVVAEPETSLRFVHNGRTDENITSPHTQPGPPRTGTVIRGREADLETENNVNASMESCPDVLGKMIATIIREISKDSGGIGNLSRSLVANSVTNGQMGQSHVNQTRRHQNPELNASLEVIKKTMKLDAAAPFNQPVDPVALGIPLMVLSRLRQRLHGLGAKSPFKWPGQIFGFLPKGHGLEGVDSMWENRT